MPLRHFSREQAWLLPPTLDELVGGDHPAMFAAAFADGLDATRHLTPSRGNLPRLTTQPFVVP